MAQWWWKYKHEVPKHTPVSKVCGALWQAYRKLLLNSRYYSSELLFRWLKYILLSGLNSYLATVQLALTLWLTYWHNRNKWRKDINKWYRIALRTSSWSLQGRYLTKNWLSNTIPFHLGRVWASIIREMMCSLMVQSMFFLTAGNSRRNSWETLWPAHLCLQYSPDKSRIFFSFILLFLIPFNSS